MYDHSNTPTTLSQTRLCLFLRQRLTIICFALTLSRVHLDVVVLIDCSPACASQTQGTIKWLLRRGGFSRPRARPDAPLQNAELIVTCGPTRHPLVRALLWGPSCNANDDQVVAP